MWIFANVEEEEQDLLEHDKKACLGDFILSQMATKIQEDILLLMSLE